MEYDFTTKTLREITEKKGRGIKTGRDGQSVRRYAERLREGLAGLARFPADAAAIYRKDPALRGKLLGFLETALYASFWALFFYRIAHALYAARLSFFARFLSQVARFLTGIEIHPGARIGPGLFIDHGMGTVIGETAVIGRNVLLFHGVTLGGTKFVPGRRHPELGDDVLVGAGAKILGAVRIGNGAKIGAQAVVLTDVPASHTAVGIPARVFKSGERDARVSPCCAGTS